MASEKDQQQSKKAKNEIFHFLIKLSKISQYRLIFLVSLFLVLFDNLTFFSDCLKVYPLNQGLDTFYILSLGLVLLLVTFFVLSVFASKYTTKGILIVILIVSAFVKYFMSTYHVVIDSVMITNVMQTNIHESSDLFSFKLVLDVVLFGLLPSYLVFKAKVVYKSIKKELVFKIIFLFSSLVFIILIMIASGRFYASFLREHKPLRYYTNPTFWIYNVIKYSFSDPYAMNIKLKKIGLDAKIPNQIKKRLLIVVVGESARGDRFSLNGYSEDTNPLLSKEKNLISFGDMRSCGTSTAFSVPCMFSILTRSNYSMDKAKRIQNVLDVLDHTKKVSILWRDNNSDSKGVAIREKHENYKTSKLNTICDKNGNCRDVGMLVGLDKYIKKQKNKNILIVLHQMGSHGPAYYKRYPKSFEKFKPICHSNQLEKCTEEEVNNAYDNTILYTDYFLSKTIDFLKPFNKTYQTAMIYMSDHGESLGKDDIYLHGMPYFMAPIAQRHIGSVLWLGKGLAKEDYKKINLEKDERFSQDNLFSTILGFFHVKTKVYTKKLDILAKN